MRISDWSSDVCSSDLKRLRPRIATDPGDDRHQRGERNHMLDRAAEDRHDGRGDERGAEIGDQPAHPRAVGFADRLVDVAVAGARQAQDILARLFLDDVNDTVDRNNADQPPETGTASGTEKVCTDV